MTEEVEIQEMPQVEQMAAGDPPDGREKLYKRLTQDGLYTKSFDEFKNQFSTKDKIDLLYSKLNGEGLYTKQKNDFYNQFFTEVTKTPSVAKVDFKQADFFPKTGQQPAVQGQQPTTFFEDVQTQYSVPSATALLPEAKRYSQLEKSVKEAQSKLAQAIQTNDDVKTKMIRQRRFEDAAFMQELPKSDMGQTQADIDMERFALPETKPQDLPVTKEDLDEENLGLNLDEGKARKLVTQIGKDKPGQKNELQKSVYLLDATRSMFEGEKANERTPKVLKNARDIASGKLEYDVRTGKLYKPEGFLASTVTGWKEKTKGFDFFDFAYSAPKEEVIARMEKEMADYDPDAPIPVPKNKFSELTQMLGGTPLTPMVAGGIVSAAGVPEAAPLAAAATGGEDMYRLGWANEFRRSYQEFRGQGLTPEESYDKAKELSDKTAKADFVMGAAMGLVGARTGFKSGVNFSPSFRGAVVTALKKSNSGLKGAILEGLAGGGIGAAGQSYKNELAKEAGLDRDLSEGVFEQLEGNLLMTVGISVAARAGRGLSNVNYRSILKGLAGLGKENLESKINEQVSTGQLTEQQAQNVRTEVENFQAVDQQIPGNVTEEARFKIADKIAKRSELEGQLETLNKAFHPAIKEKITKLDEEINALAQEKEKPVRPTKEDSEVKNIIDDAVDEGLISDMMAPIAKSDPKGFMKMIADQVYGQSNEGELYGLNAEQAAREQFGDIIVDKAKELFPPKIQENELPTSNEEMGGVKGRQGAGQEIGGEGGEQGRPEARPQGGEENIITGKEKVESDPNWIFSKREGEPGTVGITHEQMDQVAREFGLETYETAPEKVAEWDEQAAKRIVEPGQLDKLFDKLRKGETPDAVETRMMLQYMADLKAKVTADPNAENLNQLKRTKDLFNIAGRLQGQALRARQGERPVEETLPDFYIREMEASGVGELTEQQKATAQKEFTDISQAEAALNEKVAQLEADNARLKAEQEVKKAAAGKKREKKDYSSERQQIFADIKEKLRKARGDTSATFVPYAKELFAIAPDVAKLVKNLVEEGIDKLPDIVANIHGQLKDLIPGIKEKDVHDLIAGEYNEKRGTQSEITGKIRDLQTQAKLINKLEALRAGVEPKSEKAKIRRNREIEELKRQIKEHDLTKIAALKTRTKSEIAKLEEKLKNKDFDPEVKEPLELDEEGIELQDKLIDLRRERELRLAQHEYDKQSKAKKLWDYWGRGILDLRRAVGTSLDFSVPGRQASPVTFNPRYIVTTAKSFKEQFAQWASGKRYYRWWEKLKNDSDFNNMVDDGLAITPPDELFLTQREEQFRTRLAEDVPILGAAVKMSNRAASGYLNTMRVDLYRKFASIMEDKGITRQGNPEAYKTMAHYIGSLTGRGELPQALKAAEGLLGDVFFGPRLMAAKFNLLNPKRYFDLPPYIRRRAWFDLAIRAGMYVTVGKLLQASGASISLDPDDPDFMKVKYGDTRYDITGGAAVYIRTALRVLKAGWERVTGKEKDSIKTASKAGLSGLSFFRNKLAPTPAYLLDAFTGKKSTGQPFDPIDIARVYPMWIDDMADDWKDNQAGSIFTAAIPSIFGIGVMTYTKEDKEDKGSGKRNTRASNKKQKRESR